MMSKTSIVKKSPKCTSHDDIKMPHTPIPITPKKSRTGDIISKLKRVQCNSNVFCDEKPKWFHHKKGRNDFLDTSSKDDFVTLRSLKKVRIKKPCLERQRDSKNQVRIIVLYEHQIMMLN